MQTDPSREIGNTFSRSWQLLSSNWIIIVPAIIIGAIAGLIAALVTPQYVTDSVTGFPTFHSMLGLPLGVGIAIGSFVGFVGSILTLTITTGMADAAWKTGSTTIADGMGALQRPNVMSAMLVLAAVALVLSFLTMVTLGLAAIVEIVVFFFLIYTLAAAVVGGFAGADALKESFDVAKSSWLTTLVVIVLLAVVGFLVGLITLPLRFIPFLGPIIGAAIQSIVVAYFSLVLVGEYKALKGRSRATVSSPPPPSTPTY